MTADINNTSLPDTGVDAAGLAAAKDAVARNEDEDSGYIAEAAISAYLAAARASVAVAVGVKALEWTCENSAIWSAEDYTITDFQNVAGYPVPGKRFEMRRSSGIASKLPFVTLEAAKAAAQSDFEARIRASLTAPVVETPGRARLQGTIDGLWFMGYDTIAINLADALLEFSAVEFQVPSNNVSHARPAASTASPSIAGEEARATLTALRAMVHAVCGETGFANAVRTDSGLAYPWPALDEAEALAIEAIMGETDAQYR